MNTTQLGITAASVFIVSVFSSIIINLINKPKPKPMYEEYRASREYIPHQYNVNLPVDFFDSNPKPGYNGGTRCVNCHTRLRYTRRK